MLPTLQRGQRSTVSASSSSECQTGGARPDGPVELAISSVRHKVTLSRRAQSHGPFTRSLRFAGWVSPPPRKTRFRMAGQPCPGGSGYGGSLTKGFRSFHPPFPGFAWRAKSPCKRMNCCKRLLQTKIASKTRVSANGAQVTTCATLRKAS
jgi:hypothetical protein